MVNPFVAEIRIFGGNFAPTGWATCNGQLMPISQNTALFSLLGVSYGGDGRSTFALPNLQGAAPMHPGQGQGLSARLLGETGGSPWVTLQQLELPAHSHSGRGTPVPATSGLPDGTAALARTSSNAYRNQVTNTTQMNAMSTSFTGGSAPHNNMQPYLVMNFIIALQGIFPQRP